MIAFFLIPFVVGPLSVFVIDWASGLATIAGAAGLLTPRYLVAFALLFAIALVGWLLIQAAFRRLAASRPVDGYRLLGFLPWIIIPWSFLHNVLLTVVLHAGSFVTPDAAGLWVVAFYAGAVGTFFGILFSIGVIRRFESLLPIDPVLKGEVKPSRSDVRFIVLVGLTIGAFLFGAAGVSLMSVYAGNSITFAMIRISLVAVPFLLMTVLLTWQLSHIIVSPLLKAFPELQRLASGDLTRRLTVEGVGEVDMTLAEVNTFVDQLAGILRSVGGASKTHEDAAKTLFALAENQQEIAKTTTGEVESVSTRMRELTEQVDSSAGATEEITRTIDSLRVQIDQQNDAINETVAAAEELNASTRQVVDTSEKKQQAAGELRTVASESHRRAQSAVETVETIASEVGDLMSLNGSIAALSAQTNMLAMNAAIEAAHAGEAGKGFAVVASEIRALAESAARNAKESGVFLKQIIDGIENTARVIREVDVSFERVDTESESLADSLGEIVASAREMNQTAVDIAQQMDNVKQINLRVVHGVKEIGQGAVEITQAAHGTREIAATVDGKMPLLVETMASLLTKSKELMGASMKISENAMSLTDEIKGFEL
jgi:methyl-accepting chemotaxis protein